MNFLHYSEIHFIDHSQISENRGLSQTVDFLYVNNPPGHRYLTIDYAPVGDLFFFEADLLDNSCFLNFHFCVRKVREDHDVIEKLIFSILPQKIIFILITKSVLTVYV